jgi:hypothetical protein
MKPPRHLAQLTPNDRNPRVLTPAKRAALIKSLAEFGDLSGFVFNRRTCTLIGGHQRRSILPPESEIVITERLKKPDTLGTVARGHVVAGADRIPYREVDWPEPKATAAMIAANRQGGDFTRGMLAELLAEIESAGLDTDLTGYFGEALLEARKQAYDSLSKLTAVLDAEKKSDPPVPGKSPSSKGPAAGSTPAPQPASNILLAFTLTAGESGRWSAVKKQLDIRDDKKAFLGLVADRLDGERGMEPA